MGRGNGVELQLNIVLTGWKYTPDGNRSHSMDEHGGRHEYSD
jgi:hypothetical protein